MTIAEELQKLEDLRRAGTLSDEEFAQAKERVLSASQPPPVPPVPIPTDDAATKERQTRQWAMLLHLSLLAGFLVPFAGLIVPIVIWQVKKTDLPGLDPHGKMVVNWMISACLYAILCFLLIFVIVGIPLILALCLVAIVFPIIGAIKANDGVLWKYPLTITFLS